MALPGIMEQLFAAAAPRRLPRSKLPPETPKKLKIQYSQQTINKVKAALTDEPASTRAIQHRCGGNVDMVRKCLVALEEDGQAVFSGFGRYGVKTWSKVPEKKK